ncbi:MAG TPA: IS1595 family transposase [Rhizomicrobium sp.]|jgi:transposase-like protein|nr:IS1595 family transposase [Rhizomicrobium sp.]
MPNKTKSIQQMTLPQWEKAFPDEDACDAYLVTHRWPSGKVKCPRCGSERVYELKTRKWHWECPDCRTGGAYRFSDITGTIFENTNKDLRDWFRVIHLMLTGKKGISALQVQRQLGFGSYRTAWYMCHRVRAGLANEEFRKLMGIVEVDETYIGGDDGNRHLDKKKGNKGKTIVIGAVERKGNVVARVIDRADHYDMEQFIHMVCGDKVSLLATDEHRAYASLKDTFPHGQVTHSKRQYVVGAIHTNTIEGFWSLFKRSIVGSFHQVSRKYLPLYIAEAQFRYNNRHNPDIFGAAIAGL